jgi:hypothetical protein
MLREIVQRGKTEQLKSTLSIDTAEFLTTLHLLGVTKLLKIFLKCFNYTMDSIISY